MSPRTNERLRACPPPRFKGMGSWFSLALLILALFVVLMARRHLANSAASCYTTVTTEQREDYRPVSEMPDPEPNVRVIPPPQDPAESK